MTKTGRLDDDADGVEQVFKDKAMQQKLLRYRKLMRVNSWMVMLYIAIAVYQLCLYLTNSYSYADGAFTILAGVFLVLFIVMRHWHKKSISKYNGTSVDLQEGGF